MATTSSDSPPRGTSDSLNSSTNNQNVPLSSNELEDVLMELNRFEKNPSENIPTILERYLKHVAKTGNTNFPWSKMKPLFRIKLENVISDFSAISPTDEIPPVPNVDVFNFAAIKNKVFEQLDAFAGIPFTVQRLAELLTTPRRHYKRTDKFMRALEKNMLIVSTVEARANNNENSNNYFINGDYLSNGNMSNESNGSTSPDLSKPHPGLRDHTEDELDTEMPEIPVASSEASAGIASPPPQASNPTDAEIEDEMVNEMPEETEAVGSSSEEQCKTEMERSDQVEKVTSGSEENQVSPQSSAEPEASTEEAMEVENGVESSTSSDLTSNSSPSVVVEEAKKVDVHEPVDHTDENDDTPMNSVTPSSTSENVAPIESAPLHDHVIEDSNEATACSTSDQPPEEEEAISEKEAAKENVVDEQVNSSTEAVTKPLESAAASANSEPGSTEETSSEVAVESTD